MMTEGAPGRQNNKDLIFLAAFFAVAIVFFELLLAATAHYNSRDQHLGGAVAYARGHINLLRPMLLGFTVNGTPTPLEFPVWQALTAVLMKCFGIWYGWGNVVSLFFFFGSLWPVFDLCRRMGSSRIAWWTVLFTLIQPLSWWIGGQAGGDSTAWAFAMWLIYGSYRMMSEGKWSWWLVAACAAGLSATTKAPFFMAAGLTAFFWLLLHHRRSARAWLSLISVGVVGCLFFMAWNYHCHRVYAEADFSTINLDPFDKKSGINQWYFGTLAYRLNIGNWLRGSWHLAGCILGGFAFIVLVLVATHVKKSAEAWLWMLAAICTAIVFTPLILEHLHYFFIFAPATAWLCALAAAEIETGFWDRLRIPIPGRAAILLITFTISLIGSFIILHMDSSLMDTYVEEVGQVIKDHTAPDEKIVVWGMIWGDPFLQADRDGYTGGLNIHSNDWINDPKKLNRLKELGYTKIVLVNQSPTTIALTESTPHPRGHQGKDVWTLENLHECVPTVAKNWPVAYDSPQILILQIPGSHPIEKSSIGTAASLHTFHRLAL